MIHSLGLLHFDFTTIILFTKFWVPDLEVPILPVETNSADWEEREEHRYEDQQPLQNRVKHEVVLHWTRLRVTVVLYKTNKGGWLRRKWNIVMVFIRRSWYNDAFIFWYICNVSLWIFAIGLNSTHLLISALGTSPFTRPFKLEMTVTTLSSEDWPPELFAFIFAYEVNFTRKYSVRIDIAYITLSIHHFESILGKVSNISDYLSDVFLDLQAFSFI